MSLNEEIALLSGDGIGPELVEHGAKPVLEAVSDKWGHKFTFSVLPFGASAYYHYSSVFPIGTKMAIPNFRAIIKGPIGLGPKESEELRAAGVKLENDSVIELRTMLDASTAYRPVRLPLNLQDISPLKPERLGQGINMLMLRELVGGSYVARGKVEGKDNGWKISNDPCEYTEQQVVRFAHTCFKEARNLGTKLTMIQKPNVLATGRFWEHHFSEIAKQYPDVKYGTAIVDAFAANLVMKPTIYNGVVAEENLQGDILTDLGLGVVGSLGLGAAACWNPDTRRGFVEPTHGSAPDIAGKGIANPSSMIGSVAYMFDLVFKLKEESDAIWSALNQTLSEGYRTRELVMQLDNLQKSQRVQRHIEEFKEVYWQFNPNLSREEITKAVTEHYQRRDAELEARVVSTAQFGNLVAERIRRAA